VKDKTGETTEVGMSKRVNEVSSHHSDKKYTNPMSDEQE